MGQLILPDAAIIYVDTAIVIYSVEFNPDYWQVLQPLWTKLQLKQLQIITSELTILEALVVPLRTQNTILIDTYEQLFSSQIDLIPIEQSILKEAAQLRATTSLKTPDAIHAATALSANCTIFLTNDAKLRSIPNLPVIVLSEVLSTL
jgi:predicted nucleic acid-binding protein